MHSIRSDSVSKHQERIIEALAAIWRAQPDLGISDVLTQIANRHGGPGASDEEFLQACHSIQAEILGALPEPLHPDQTLLLHTTKFYVAIRGQHALLMRKGAQPVHWRYEHVASAQVGGPLLLADAEFQVHNYGTIQSIRVGSAEEQAAVCEDAIAMGRGQHVHLWRQQRRAVGVEKLHTTLEAAVGQSLILGGVDYGAVVQTFDLG